MKAFKWFFLVVVLSIEVFSQSGFYTYLNKSADQLIREKGQPAEVTNTIVGKMYFYRYKNYISSYMVQRNRIVIVIVASGWAGLGKAQSVAQYEAQLCRNDGFTVTKNSSGYRAVNKTYTITIKVEQVDNGYEVSSTAELR
jgi:hypothetical protein